VANQINEEIIEASRTTPDAITLNRLLSQMVNSGCEYCFMEVSSHSVSEKEFRVYLFRVEYLQT
jgi:UDP-N-acetylmuramoyl-L-alanyl-D-glutamate--2,6-diaminopimelate ligase